MPGQILVTSYDGPDLDGTACAYAYAELLNKKGRGAKVFLVGNPSKETKFVAKFFNIELERAYAIEPDAKVILVDASEIENIPKGISTEKVIEIIDHRMVNDAKEFPNAIVQIEFVGAAATLIAEKFHDMGIEPTANSAALLYSAIVSNTVNFKANVTTLRDVKMSDWLSAKIKIPEDYTQKMFNAKSNMDEPLDFTLSEELATFKICGKSVGIIQLEIINAEGFVSANIKPIKEFMEKTKIETKFDYLLLTCIDVEKSLNWIVATDEDTSKLLGNALGIEFEGPTALHSGIIMRKEIVPKIKNVLESRQ